MRASALKLLFLSVLFIFSEPSLLAQPDSVDFPTPRVRYDYNAFKSRLLDVLLLPDGSLAHLHMQISDGLLLRRYFPPGAREWAIQLNASALGAPPLHRDIPQDLFAGANAKALYLAGWHLRASGRKTKFRLGVVRVPLDTTQAPSRFRLKEKGVYDRVVAVKVAEEGCWLLLRKEDGDGFAGYERMRLSSGLRIASQDSIELRQPLTGHWQWLKEARSEGLTLANVPHSREAEPTRPIHLAHLNLSEASARYDSLRLRLPDSAIAYARPKAQPRLHKLSDEAGYVAYGAYAQPGNAKERGWFDYQMRFNVRFEGLYLSRFGPKGEPRFQRVFDFDSLQHHAEKLNEDYKMTPTLAYSHLAGRHWLFFDEERLFKTRGIGLMIDSTGGLARLFQERLQIDSPEGPSLHAPRRLLDEPHSMAELFFLRHHYDTEQLNAINRYRWSFYGTYAQEHLGKLSRYRFGTLPRGDHLLWLRNFESVKEGNLRLYWLPAN